MTMVEGTQLGTYRVVRQLGEGGLGEVWLAEHTMLGRRAAIKVLRPEFSRRPEIVQRFFNEARAATAIGDPGVIQIFDFGNHTDGSAYIVMELLEGEPLDRRLERLGVLEPIDALRIMRQVSSTLGAVHVRGIVHRDLKPENIFIVRDPEVPGGERAKVLDFGIAKIGHMLGSASSTQTSAVLGTPLYMSPEQCRGAGGVDQRSDVYALGCVMFQLVCGQPPFKGDGFGEIILQHMTSPPPVPSTVHQGVSPDLDTLILRCLEKDPQRRFPSGAELAVAIGALVGSSPGLTASVAIPTFNSTLADIANTRRRPRARVVVGGIVLLVTGAIVAAVVVGGRDADHEVAAAAPILPAAPLAQFTAPPDAFVLALDAAPDPMLALAERMTEIFAAFVAWSRSHVGAAPSGSRDAARRWGRPLGPSDPADLHRPTRGPDYRRDLGGSRWSARVHR